MLEPKAHIDDGRVLPFSQLPDDFLAELAFDPRVITDDDATAQLVPGFHRQYARRLLLERPGRSPS